MKTSNTTIARSYRSQNLLAGALLVAVAALSACAASHHFAANAGAPPVATRALDDAPVAPLVGRDYAMRLDTQRGRVLFFRADAALSGIHPADVPGCHGDVAALEPGLWLAVAETRADGQRELVLQPLGSTAPARSTGVSVLACGETATASAIVLPQGLRTRMLERGGVLFVDGDNAQNARDVAFAQKSP